MKSVVHVVNRFRSGAIPNIIRDLEPYIRSRFNTSVISLEIVSRDDAAFQEFADLGIKIYDLGCQSWNVPAQFLKLRQKLKELSPDIVHGHTGRSQFLAPICAPSSSKAIVTAHTVLSGYNAASRAAFALTERYLSRRIFVSKVVARSWRRSEYASSDVLYNPVNIDSLEQRSVQNHTLRPALAGDGQCLFLSVGRLTEPKGQIDLVRAAAYLVDRGTTSFHIVIAGRGPFKDTLQTEIKNLRVGNYVTLLGFRNDVPTLLSVADVFLFPSRWEGFGLALVEAFASGTPVICTDLDVFKEVAGPCELKTYRAGMITELGELMASAIDDISGFARSVEALRERAYEFHPSKQAQRMIDVYEGRVTNIAQGRNDHRANQSS